MYSTNYYDSIFDMYGSGYGSEYGFGYGPMVSGTQIVIVALILAVVATVLALIFITPENRRAKLPEFFKFIHDTFNFKYLVLEKVLKALYIFATCSSILVGFFLLFQRNGLIGLAIMLLGPIAIRIIFEMLMLMILLVRNVIEINKKLGKSGDSDNSPSFDFKFPKHTHSAPTQHTAPAAQYVAPQNTAPVTKENFVYCTMCGTRYDENAGNCPNCQGK